MWRQATCNMMHTLLAGNDWIKEDGTCATVACKFSPQEQSFLFNIIHIVPLHEADIFKQSLLDELALSVVNLLS